MPSETVGQLVAVVLNVPVMLGPEVILIIDRTYSHWHPKVNCVRTGCNTCQYIGCLIWATVNGIGIRRGSGCGGDGYGAVTYTRATGCGERCVALIPGPAVTVVCLDPAQPLASVNVTVWLPAETFVNVLDACDAPPSREYVYGAVPLLESG